MYMQLDIKLLMKLPYVCLACASAYALPLYIHVYWSINVCHVYMKAHTALPCDEVILSL